MYIVNSMKREEAVEISKWKYEKPYDFYSFSGSDEEVEHLLCGNYYSVKNKVGDLIGYYCYGKSAQVPTGHKYGAYDDDQYLDIGLGMKPQLTGDGRGMVFVSNCVNYARNNLGATKLRLTVADFNKRAISTYETAGFKNGLQFTRVRSRDGKIIPFVMMYLDK